MSTQELCLTMDDKHLRRVGRLPTELEVCVVDDARWVTVVTFFRDDVGEISMRFTPDMMQEIVELFTEIIADA